MGKNSGEGSFELLLVALNQRRDLKHVELAAQSTAARQNPASQHSTCRPPPGWELILDKQFYDFNYLGSIHG